jgi:hypothetical protein
MLVRDERGGGRLVHPFPQTSAPLTDLPDEGNRHFRATQAVQQGFVSSERLGTALATIATDQALIEAVVGEMQDGIERAVGFWMTQIEQALRDPGLTTLGRMNVVREIVNRYAAGRTGENHGYAA